MYYALYPPCIYHPGGVMSAWVDASNSGFLLGIPGCQLHWTFSGTLKKSCVSWCEERWGWKDACLIVFHMGVQQSLDHASSSRSIKVQMACFRQYIECTPSWLSSEVCMCAATGVRRFCGRWLYSTGGRILKMQSSYNNTAAAGILTDTSFICSFQSVYFEQSLGLCCVDTRN